MFIFSWHQRNSSLECLLPPVTLHDIIPFLLRNEEQAADIVLGTCPTRVEPFFTATAKGSLKLCSSLENALISIPRSLYTVMVSSHWGTKREASRHFCYIASSCNFRACLYRNIIPRKENSLTCSLGTKIYSHENLYPYGTDTMVWYKVWPCITTKIAR